MTTMLANRLLSSAQVAAFSGASYRQLDYWVRTGILVPAVDGVGSGSRRGFSADDARIAWLITQVQDDGGSRHLAALVGAVEQLRSEADWTGFLVTSGRGSAVAHHAVDLLDALHQLGPAAIVVALDACPDPPHSPPRNLR